MFLVRLCVFCEFVTFPLVSWVRCGTWLYWFLIFAPLLTFTSNDMVPDQTAPLGAVWSGFILFASLKKSSLMVTWIYVADIKADYIYRTKKIGGIIRIYHECEGGIEKMSLGTTICHHSASPIDTARHNQHNREHSGSVVECLTRDRGAAGSSLTSINALCPLARALIQA